MCDTEVKCIDLSVDANVCIAGLTDGNVIICDQRDPNLQHTYPVHNDAITSVSITPDGKNIVSCSIDGTIKLSTLSNATEIHSIETNATIR